MEINNRKVDEAVLGLLYLTLHEGNRVWKTFDFDAMDRLYAQGFILNPASRSRSVELTEEGLTKSRELAMTLFGRK